MKSLARGSAEARNKLGLCAAGTPENLGQSLNSSTGDASHKATTTLPPTAPEHLLPLGHLFQLLVPLPLRGDLSSSLRPRRAHPQHPLLTLIPCALNLLPVAPSRSTLHSCSLCLHCFLQGLLASVLFVYYCPPTQSLSKTPPPTKCKPHNSKNFGSLPNF